MNADRKKLWSQVWIGAFKPAGGGPRCRSGAPTLDPDFAADVEGIVRNRKPWNPPAWD